MGTATEAAPGVSAEQLQAHLAAIVESSPDAIISVRLDGTITSWNGGAQSIFGYRAEEMIGQSTRCLVPEGSVAEADGILARLARGQDVQQLVTQRRHRDGRLIDVSISVSPVRDAAGQVVGAAKIVRDITALLTHEREISRMARLYAALSQINQAIVWATDRESLFSQVCRVLVEHGGLRLAWIGWRDELGQRMLPLAEFGGDGSYLRRTDIPLDGPPELQGPAAITFKSGQPCICKDLADTADAVPWRAELARRGYRAFAAFPLRLNGAVGGVIAVYADREDYFQEREVALLTEAALDVSFALDNLAREQARRQAEQHLREETLFSQTMLDSMPGVVYFYDMAGRFLRWNRNFETVTGYSAEQVAGMHPLDFFTPADRPQMAQRIAEVFTAGEATLEAALVLRDGSTRPYFFTGRRVRFRHQTCLVGVGIDISERKRAEAALRESRTHLIEAQRIAGIGSWSLDLSSNVLTWSDQIHQIFGTEAASFEPSFDDLIGFVHRDDRPALLAAQQAALAGEALLDVEHRIVLRDGTEKVVHELAALKRDADGQALALAGTVHDITARVRLTAERERRHRAEAADRVKSAFLATMSHELRTPLNSIIGFTGILLRGLAGPLNAEQSKQLGMVRSSSRHLLALVNDVLDISKIEAGQLQVARAPYEPKRVLEKVAELVAPQAQTKGLALRLQLADGLGAARGDARRFEQILLNLLSNAVKFTERGEIVITAEPAPQAGSFRVVVADTGIGIPRQHLEELFLPFRQVDAGLARSHEGTGLGLAICRRLAGLMGGEIAVDSEYGRGSRFTLTLPVQQPPAA